MNSSPSFRGALAAFVVICSSAAAATLKVKSGAVHTGKISGVIVLKGEEKETPSEQDPSKTVYSASYVVLNGADITAIDDKGIHSGGRPIGVMTVTQEGDPLEDLDIVRRGLKILTGPLATASTKAGGNIARVDGHSGQPTTRRDAVLGEYREPSANSEGELRPVIEIETATGVVKVPVADLIPLATE